MRDFKEYIAERDDGTMIDLSILKPIITGKPFYYSWIGRDDCKIRFDVETVLARRKIEPGTFDIKRLGGDTLDVRSIPCSNRDLRVIQCSIPVFAWKCGISDWRWINDINNIEPFIIGFEGYQTRNILDKTSMLFDRQGYKIGFPLYNFYTNYTGEKSQKFLYTIKLAREFYKQENNWSDHEEDLYRKMRNKYGDPSTFSIEDWIEDL